MSRANDIFGENKKIINESGARAYPAAQREAYLQMLMTNVMGNTFYVKNKELTLSSLKAHREMMTYDPDFMAKAAIYARNNGNMRLQPIIALAGLSTLPVKDYFEIAFQEIIKTPNDLIDFVTVLTEFREGRGLGRAVKRQINDYLNTIDEYRAIKYGGNRKGKWSLRDIIRATHPFPDSKRNAEIFAYLVKGKICRDTQQILAIEALKRLDQRSMHYEKDVIFLVERGKLPYEVVTGIIKPNKAIWTYLMKQMPQMALLRHLNTLNKHDIIEGETDYIVSRLTDKEAVLKSRILPFRFLVAQNNLDFQSYQINGALNIAAEAALENIPAIPGRTIWFVDESSSMTGEYITIASVLATAGMKKSETSKVFGFSTALLYPGINKEDTIQSANRKIMSVFGGGTKTDICLQYLQGTLKDQQMGYYSYGYHGRFPEKYKLKTPFPVDNIIIITDEQQNPGSNVMKAFTDYKNDVNPEVKLFIINVSPYEGRSVDDSDPNITFIYGWNTSVLDVISYRIDSGANHVRKVYEQINL